MANLLKSKSTETIVSMPLAEFRKLEGYSINGAIEEGLITSIGSKNGAFIVNSKTKGVDRKYAVVNGYGIPCSPAISDADNEDIEEIMGDLKFQTYPSSEKYLNGKVSEDGEFVISMRLTMPGGLNLDLENDVIEASYHEETKPAGKRK